jgi:hypothetical protein
MKLKQLQADGDKKDAKLYENMFASKPKVISIYLDLQLLYVCKICVALNHMFWLLIYVDYQFQFFKILHKLSGCACMVHCMCL